MNILQENQIPRCGIHAITIAKPLTATNRNSVGEDNVSTLRQRQQELQRVISTLEAENRSDTKSDKDLCHSLTLLPPGASVFHKHMSSLYYKPCFRNIGNNFNFASVWSRKFTRKESSQIIGVLQYLLCTLKTGTMLKSALTSSVLAKIDALTFCDVAATWIDHIWAFGVNSLCGTLTKSMSRPITNEQNKPKFLIILKLKLNLFQEATWANQQHEGIVRYREQHVYRPQRQ